MLIRVFLILLFAGAMVGTGLWMEYERFTRQPLDIAGDSMSLDVPRGTSLRALSERLIQAGALAHPYYFTALAYITGDASRIQAGEYEIPSGATPGALLTLLTSGKVVQRALTLVEGWTFAEAVAAVTADPRLEGSLAGATPAEIMTALGATDTHPEGRLFPDTYHFSKGTTDLDLLRRAYERMNAVLAEEWEKREPGLPLETPYQVLLLASIIETETGQASERPEIAGVFVRRLRKGMKLQTDPTVIYGKGDAFDGDLRRADLREDTPYNTYVHHGLPPTPIALPGREAINAALHPADGATLFFVAKGDGSHAFSVTLKEHNRAVRRYQLGKP